MLNEFIKKYHKTASTDEVWVAVCSRPRSAKT